MRALAVLPALSRGLARIERGALMALIAGVAGLVLVNVGARAAGRTLAWADEVAILCMTLAGFIGASLMLRMRTAPAMALAQQLAPAPAARVLRALVSALVAGFGGVLGWLCWRWLDPAGLLAAGLDVAAFEAATFNFVYTEVTPVLRLPKVWVFLVMPWFALTLTVHGLANLAEDLGLVAPPRTAGEGA